MPDWSKQTKTAQALGWIEKATGAVTPSLHPAATYLRDPDNQYRSGYGYSRNDNPGYRQCEALLSELENGVQALLFASGMAAATVVFQALPPNAHVLAPRIMYWVLRQWLLEIGEPNGLDVEFYENGDIDAIAKAVRKDKTRLIWIETPANPTWVVTDIRAVVEIARYAGARVCVDNTVPTPVLTQPLSLGADLVMHSATKYLNGHSDVLAGALISARDDGFWQRIRSLRTLNGGVLGPFEAWLLLRGMRTLHLRVQQACESAQRIAAHFNTHAKIIEVYYPGLPDSPEHKKAAKQMNGGFSGMLSLRVSGGKQAAVNVAAKVQLWKRATSLGGVESLLEHRASIEGAHSPAPPDMLRLSVGIENVQDLITDLEQGLAYAG